MQTEQTIERLRAIALEIKKEIICLAAYAKEGHCASALSIADIMTALYFHALKVDPNNPDWSERDRFVLSKGHACQALYVSLYKAGFFYIDKLHTFLEANTGLPGHPTYGGAPGIEASTGSLGHGISISVGFALASMIDKKNYRTFVLIGDGESNEGMVWEAAMCAAHYRLDNLIAILDRNNYQCDGFSDNVMRIDPVKDKWEAFGWKVRECDGHNMEELVALLDQVPFLIGKPSLILAHTIKGKGVDFMENSAEWHYRAPSESELEQAIACLDKQALSEKVERGGK